MRGLALGMIAAAGCGRVGFAELDDAGGTGRPARLLVIDGTKVAGDLVDFPVLVSIHDPAIGTSARPEGTDLRFYGADHALLAHELERFTPGGDVIAWVKVPALSSSADTTLTLEYGGAQPGAALDPATVWSNGFTNVYHFGDGSVLDTRDSTGANDGVNRGAAASPDGMIAGAAAFAGGNGGPNIKTGGTGIDTANGGLNTLSYWMEYTGPAGQSPATFAYTDCGGGCDYDMWLVANGCFGFNTAQGEVLGTTMTGLFDRWVYVAGVFFNGTPSAATNVMYIDGVRQTLTGCSAGTPAERTAGGPIYWGSYRGYELVGRLDEGRVARGARSAAWIATEYANQREPSTFVTVR